LISSANISDQFTTPVFSGQCGNIHAEMPAKTPININANDINNPEIFIEAWKFICIA
jgi:hypothetical protein